MASLRMKMFVVQVFVSSSLLEVQPDVTKQVSAVTEFWAIGSVMKEADLVQAGVVYVQCEGQERWFYGVSLRGSDVQYEHVM